LVIPKCATSLLWFSWVFNKLFEGLAIKFFTALKLLLFRCVLVSRAGALLGLSTDQ